MLLNFPKVVKLFIDSSLDNFDSPLRMLVFSVFVLKEDEKIIGLDEQWEQHKIALRIAWISRRAW